MKLSREDLKHVSAGASAVEFGLLNGLNIQAVLAFFVNLIKQIKC